MNFLEQLCFEWFEFKATSFDETPTTGQLKSGGFECELDIVAFHPNTRHIVHIEPSMDAHSWAERERRYQKKFRQGAKYVHT